MSQVYDVKIGEAVVSAKGTVMKAVLGSCVAVCLFDPETGVGGMIHAASTIESESHPFRNCASSLERLFEALLNISDRPLSFYKAKVVGAGEGRGARKFQTGNTNGEFVLQALKEKGIEVLAKDLGGREGRLVFFHPSSGRLQISRFEIKAPITNPKQEKTKVFIVDDSPVMRKILKKIFSRNIAIDVAGEASDPLEAMEKLKELKVDVVTLDINMPKMSGLDFLKTWLPDNPKPVVMVSAVSLEDGNEVLDGLELGAVDYIQKPDFEQLEEQAPYICEKVVAAGQIPPKLIGRKELRLKVKKQLLGEFGPIKALAIGASTGGTEAIKSLLMGFPNNIPPVVITQHIPPVFSKAFAQRMNSLCPFLVKEAEDGDKLRENTVLVAPGGKQMKVVSKGGELFVSINDDAPVNRHKPSVDYLFHSVAKEVGKDAIGVILTGMGEDGAKGLLAMRKAGASTVAQNEETCVVYGMPKEAVKIGAAEKVIGLDDIASYLVEVGAEVGKERAVS